MIRIRTTKKPYVSPEIEIMECGEEIMLGTISTKGPDQPPVGPWGAKRALVDDVYPEFEDDFEDDFDDDFNYQTYKKQMLW